MGPGIFREFEIRELIIHNFPSDSPFSIVKKNREGPYGYSERQWQLIRRGHYTEFNLVYDRGTKFGFNTPGARYESILMSLPLHAKWEYMNKVTEGSREAKLTEVFD